MGLEWLILLAVFFFVMSAVREGAKTVKRTPRPPSGRPERRDTLAELRDAFADTSPGLRDLLDAIEQAQHGRKPARPESPKTVPRAPRDDKPDDFTSLETVAEEVVVERVPDRASRREVDLDEESIAAAERRRAWADRRDVPARARPADVPVPPVAADHTAVAIPAPGASLREAIIWREILGPPRALQDD